MKRTLSLRRWGAALLMLLALLLALPEMAPTDAAGTITRAQLAELLMEHFPVPVQPETGTGFPDLGSCTERQRTAIHALAAAGILQGRNNGTFDPDGAVTRGEGTLVLWRAMGRPGGRPEDTTFGDLQSCPPDMQEAIYALTRLGVVNGTRAGLFGPGSPLEVDAARIMLSRIDRLSLTLDGDGHAQAGDTVTLKAVLPAGVQVGGVLAELSYDPTVLELNLNEDIRWPDQAGTLTLAPGGNSLPAVVVNDVTEQGAARKTIRMAYVGDLSASGWEALFSAAFTVTDSVKGLSVSPISVVITQMADKTGQHTVPVDGSVVCRAGSAFLVLEEVPAIQKTEPQYADGPQIETWVRGVDPTGVSAYELYRWKAEEADELSKGVRAATLTEGLSDAVLNLTDTGAMLGESYVYRVRVRSGLLAGSWSEPSQAVAVPLLDAPKLTDLQMSGGAQPSVVVKWKAITPPKGLGVQYRVYRDDGEGWTLLTTVGADKTSYTDSTVSFGQEYRYTVRAEAILAAGFVPGVFDGEGLSVLMPASAAPVWEQEPQLSDGGVISMAWSRVEDAEGYLMIRESEKLGVFEWIVEEQEGSSVYFVDEELLPATSGRCTYTVIPLMKYGGEGGHLVWTGEISIPAAMAPVQALRAVAAGSEGVELSWSGTAERYWVSVLRALDGETMGESLVVTESSATVLGLTENTQYVALVAPVVDGVKGQFTEEFFTTLPAAPADLRSGYSNTGKTTQSGKNLHLYSGKLTLGWENQSDYDGIVIHRNGVQVASLDGTALSWQDESALSGSVTYTVQGYVFGENTRIFTDAATLSLDIPVVERVSLLEPEGNSEVPNVSRPAGVEGVLVQYRKPGTSKWSIELLEDVQLSGGQSWQVQVAGYVRQQGIYFLSPFTDIREDRYGALEAPTWAAEPILSHRGTAVRLSWQHPGGYDGYAVYQNGLQVFAGPADVRSCVLSGLAAGQSCTFTVRGYHLVHGRAVMGEASAEQTYTVPVLTAPDLLTATRQDGAAELTWQKVILDGFTVRYELVRTAAGSKLADPVTVVEQQLSEQDGTMHYMDQTVAPVTYTYQVRAYVSLEDGTVYYGPLSAPSKAVQMGGFGVGSVVDNVQASPVDGATLKLSWNKVDGAKGYELYRLEGAYTGPEQLTENHLLKAGLTTLSYEDKASAAHALEQGTVYTYLVRAYYLDESGQPVYNQPGQTAGCIRKAAVELPEEFTATATTVHGVMSFPGDLGDNLARPESIVVALNGKKVEELKTLPSTALKKGIDLSGLKPDSSYTLTVTASYKLGSKTVSTVYTTEVRTERPQPVSAVQAQPYRYIAPSGTAVSGSGEVLVTWLPTEGAEGYQITLQPAVGGGELVSNVSKGDVGSVVVKGSASLSLQAGQEYVVQVAPVWKDAGNQTQLGEASAEARVTLPNVSDWQAEPFTVEWVEDSGLVRLSLSDGSADHSYAIYRKEGTAKGAFVLLDYMDATAHYTDTTAQRSKEYTYSLRPYVRLADGICYEGQPYRNNEGVEGLTVTTANLKAPEQVQAGVVDGTTIRISWSRVDEATGYLVERVEQKDGKELVTKVGTVAQTAGRVFYELDDSKAVQGVSYRYRVSATTKTLTGNPAEVEKSIPIPAAVESVELIQTDTDTVELRVIMADADWSDRFAETQGKWGWAGIFVKEGSKWSWAQYNGQSDGADYVNATQLTYTIRDLKPGTSYTFAVRGINQPDIGTKAYTSAEAVSEQSHNMKLLTVTTVMPQVSGVSAIQSGVNAQSSSAGVTVGWETVAGASGYQIYRLPAGQQPDENTTPLNSKAVTGTEYVDGAVPLTDGLQTEYAYWVVALGSAKEASPVWSEPAAVTLLPMAQVVSVDAREDDSGTAVRVEWQQTQNAFASGFYVERWETDPKTHAVNKATKQIFVVEGTDVSCYVDESVRQGVLYTYGVQSFVGQGSAIQKGDWKSDLITLSVFDRAPAPTATEQDGPAVRLSWPVLPTVGGGFASEYEIYRAKGTQGRLELVKCVSAVPGDSMVYYVDRDVESRSEYRYQVVACLDMGHGRVYSDASEIVKARSGYDTVQGIHIVGDSQLVAGQAIPLALKLDTTGSHLREVEVVWVVQNGKFVANGRLRPELRDTEHVTVQADEGAEQVTVTVIRGDLSDSHTITVRKKSELPVSGGQSHEDGILFELTAGGKLTLPVDYRPSDGVKRALIWTMEPADAAVGSIKNNVFTAAAVSSSQTIRTEVWVDEDGDGQKSASDPVRILYLCVRPKGTDVQIWANGQLVAAPGLKNATYTVDISDAQTIRLRAEVLPQGASQRLSWKSSSDQIASVDAQGRVSLHGVGSVTITATAEDGSKKSASFKLDVRYLTASKKISLKLVELDGMGDVLTDVPKMGLPVGHSYQLVLVDEWDGILPGYFFVEDKAGAVHGEVVDGVPGGYRLTGLRTGSVTVTALLADDPSDRKATLSLKVVDALVSLDGFLVDGVNLPDGDHLLPRESLTLDRHDSLDYVFTLRPVGQLSGHKLTYQASNSKVASVKGNADGSATVTVKAGAAGETYITATASDAAKTTLSFYLEVRDGTPVLPYGSKYTINPNAKYPSTQRPGIAIPLEEGQANPIRNVTVQTYNGATKRYTDGTEPLLSSGWDAHWSTVELLLLQAVPKSAVQLRLVVETEKGIYYLPVELSFKASTPKVTVKQGSEKFDLLYNDGQARADFQFAVSDGTLIEWVALENSSFALLGEQNGQVVPNGDSVSVGWRYNESGAIAGNAAKPDTKLNFVVKLEGYEPIPVSAAVATTTTKPTLLLSASKETFDRNGVLMSVLTVSLGGSKGQPAQTLYLNPSRDQVTTSTDGAQVHIADNGSIVVTVTESGKNSVAVPMELKLGNWNSAVKLSYTATLEDKTVTVKPEAATLQLNRTFWAAGTEASTPLLLSQVNRMVTNMDYEPEAKAGENGAKIRLLLDSYSGILTALPASGDDRPAPGSYKYQLTFTLDNGEQVNSSVTVKVVEEQPTVKPSVTTLNLNAVLAGEEQGLTRLALSQKGYTEAEGYAVVGAVLDEQSSALDGSQLQLSMAPDTGNLSVRLSGHVAAGSYKINLRVTVSTPNGGTVELSAPVALTIKVYSADSFTATVTGKGTLSLSKGGEILYTVTKLSNIMGEVEQVWLEDEMGGFRVEMLGTDAKGQATFRLYMEDWMLAGQYTVRFRMTLKGMSQLVESAPVKITVGK